MPVPRSAAPVAIAALVLWVTAPATLAGQEADAAVAGEGTGRAVPESVAGPAAPVDTAGALLRGSDLPWAGALAGSLALAAAGPGLDEDVAREASADPGGLGGIVADGGDVAGSPWLDYGAAAGAFAVSRAAGWDEAGRVAVRVLVALAATDVSTGGLKVAFGRARPGADRPEGARLDAGRFDPVSFDEERRSLPSGHTARMFAVASTLDRELGDRAPWLPWVAYPVAGLTGAGRVIEREHWVTDVVSGAALGLLTSRVAGRLFRRGEEPTAGISGPRPWVASRDGAFALGVTLPAP